MTREGQQLWECVGRSIVSNRRVRAVTHVVWRWGPSLAASSGADILSDSLSQGWQEGLRERGVSPTRSLKGLSISFVVRWLGPLFV